jgi:hypothetical protein
VGGRQIVISKTSLGESSKLYSREGCTRIAQLCQVAMTSAVRSPSTEGCECLCTYSISQGRAAHVITGALAVRAPMWPLTCAPPDGSMLHCRGTADERLHNSDTTQTDRRRRPLSRRQHEDLCIGNFHQCISVAREARREVAAEIVGAQLTTDSGATVADQFRPGRRSSPQQACSLGMGGDGQLRRFGFYASCRTPQASLLNPTLWPPRRTPGANPTGKVRDARHYAGT